MRLVGLRNWYGRSGGDKILLLLPKLNNGSSSGGAVRGKPNERESTWKKQLERNIRMIKEIWLGEVKWLHLAQDMTRDVLVCVR